MAKAVFNVAEFTKLMLYNCIKVVRLNLTNLTSGYGPDVCVDKTGFLKPGLSNTIQNWCMVYLSV